jgi:hypothetical protein
LCDLRPAPKSLNERLNQGSRASGGLPAVAAKPL